MKRENIQPANIQHPMNDQTSSTKSAPRIAWNLDLGISLELGTWTLGALI